ncbi:MAG: NYN domain-containing protein [Candidatus Binatia bacterium]|jgi:predicted RNA-binding protein with PIN domain
MDIIIDGYNLIGSQTGLSGNLEGKRSGLVQQLASYQRRKGYRVTIVFDGWRSGGLDEVKEKSEEVSIVYSRLGEKADNVVIRLARQRGSGCVVVTSDNEVRNAVERFGAVALHAAEFSATLRDVAFSIDADDPEDSERAGPKKGNPKRLSKKERKRREKLHKLKS